MATPKHPKTWVLTTSQDFSPLGSLQLGQLLTNAWDPSSAVISQDLMPIPIGNLRDNQTHSNVDFTSMSREQFSFRTWLRARNEPIPAEGDIAAAQMNAAWARYQASTVMVDMFTPDDEYATKAVQNAQTERRARKPIWAPVKTLYLITGLRILSDGTNVNQLEAEAVGHYSHGAIGDNAASLPIGGGVHLQDQQSAVHSQRLGGASSFVYAYRIHKVERWLLTKNASVRSWDKGELYSTERSDDDEEEYHTNPLDVQECEMCSRRSIEQAVSASDDGFQEALSASDDTQEDINEFVSVDSAPFQGDGSENDTLLLVD